MKKEYKVIVVLIIITVFMMILNFVVKNPEITQKMKIAYDVVTKKIDATEEIHVNEILMGLTDVAGEGIIISFNDGSDLIHQEDILILVDELKNAGSQAISVNDVRITNSTYMYCDGTVILIDGVKIGTPFTIKAIGNREVIYGAVMRNKGYIETLINAGINISVDKSERISINRSNRSTFKGYENLTNDVEKLATSNRIVGKSIASGKGLQITIYEIKAKLTAVTFIQIINDLNSAGAEAISINGNRVTNMTDLMDISKKYVLINSSLISSPYTIKVIGDPEKLLHRIYENNSYFEKVRESGNAIEIDEGKIIIESYTQKLDQNKFDMNYIMK